MPTVGEASHHGNLRYDKLHLALRSYYEDHGKDLSILLKNKTIDKFGKNGDLDSADGFVPVATIDANVTPPTTNSITHIVGGVGDTQTVSIEYHYLTAGGLFVFGIQSKTLTGATPVALDQPCARVSRMVVDRGGIPTGPIQVTIGSGGTAWAEIPANDVQTAHCWTTLSHRDVFFIDEVDFEVNVGGGGAARFRLEVRRTTEDDGTPITNPNWRPLTRDVVLSGTGLERIQFPFYKHVHPNADVRVVASSTGNNVEVEARFEGVLATIVPIPDNPDPA